jgi:hypothetical protein
MIGRYCSGLHGKFATLQNNEIFAPISELKPPYQRNSRGNFLSSENGKMWSCLPVLHTRRAKTGRRS